MEQNITSQELNTLSQLRWAFGEYGVSETNNPKRVIEYSQEIGHTEVHDTATAWCSIFANWVCMKAGLPRSNALNARSWLTVGTQTVTPMLGDIAVFWRDSIESGLGHVGFYIAQDATHIFVLGGNEGNAVSLQPYLKSHLLEFRKLQ